MTNTPISILAVDDEQLILWALERACKDRSLNIKTAESAERALKMLSQDHFDLFLIDFDLKDPTRLDLLQAVDEHCPYRPIIIMTTNDSRSTELHDAIRSVRKKGAWHLLEKPFSLDSLIGFIDLVTRDEGDVKVCLSDLTHNYDQERRRQHRRLHVQPVNYSFKTIVDGAMQRVISKAILTDISNAGSCMLIQEPLQPDQIIHFEDESLSHCGRVSWCLPIEDETYRCGVHFC